MHAMALPSYESMACDTDLNGVKLLLTMSVYYNIIVGSMCIVYYL